MSQTTTFASVATALIAGLAITIGADSSWTVNRNVVREIARAPIHTPRPNPDIGVIAHRGASKFAPENTLAGIDKAVELGFDYIEIDVRVTKDGVPVLLHDKTLDRTTDGSGPIHLSTWEEVRDLDAGSWYGPEYAGERIPTLEQALQRMQGRICAFWDTKALPTREMAALFRRYGFDRDCLLVAFGGLGSRGDLTNINRLLEVWPEAPIVPRIRFPEDVATTLADYPQTRAIVALWGRVTPELVDEAHARGVLVMASTLLQGDKPEAYRWMVDAGADYLMLANKDVFDEFLGGYQP